MKKTTKAFAALVLGSSIAQATSGSMVVSAATLTDKLSSSIVLHLDSSNAYVNGSLKPIDSSNSSVKPIVINNRTLVPIRFVVESLGYKVSWSPVGNDIQVVVQNGNNTISFVTGEYQMTVNGKTVPLDVPAVVKNNRTLIPLRALVESLGKQVSWNSEGMIIISDQSFSSSEVQQTISNLMPYKVYQNSAYVASLPTKEDAISDAQSLNHASVKDANGTSIWENYPSYKVIQYNTLLKEFNSYSDAVSFAGKWDHAAVLDKNGNWLWDDYPPLKVYQGSTFLKDFSSVSSALSYAKKYANTYLYYENKNKLVWTNAYSVKSSSILSVPLVEQNPELPKGCEMTSLDMLLRSAGLSVSKMTLANEIPKVSYSYTNGLNGNPNKGFVGDMYSWDNPGYAVYHGPVENLAKQYLPNRAVDLTGINLSDVLQFVSRGTPVWVITNATFAPVSLDTWYTPDGPVNMTWNEHSVLITGYDSNYIYINNPLYPYANEKLPRSSFEAAWNQMGHQAISYTS